MGEPYSPTTPDPEITGLLHELAGGRRAAFDQLLPLVYDHLRRLAHARLQREAPGHTLDTAALVHEAWLRLVTQHRANWQDRGHFFAVASEAMRRILVDHARHRRTAKRGSASVPLSLDNVDAAALVSTGSDSDDLLIALDDALARLANVNPQGARVVQYRFFAGLTNAEVAELLGTSERSVRRTWTVARAWLRREMSDDLPMSA